MEMTTRRSILKRLCAAIAVAFTGVVARVEEANAAPVVKRGPLADFADWAMAKHAAEEKAMGVMPADACENCGSPTCRGPYCIPPFDLAEGHTPMTNDEFWEYFHAKRGASRTF